MCVCNSDGVMRESGANDTSGELGVGIPRDSCGWILFRTANLEMLIESAS